jgi:hypothetical protein
MICKSSHQLPKVLALAIGLVASAAIRHLDNDRELEHCTRSTHRHAASQRGGARGGWPGRLWRSSCERGAV